MLRWSAISLCCAPEAQSYSRANETRLIDARARLQLSELHTRSLRDRFNKLRDDAGSTPVLASLSAARDASSDRSSKLQIAVPMAIVAGLLVGTSLVALRAGRRVG